MDSKAAARIHALTLSPGWDDLKEHLDAQEERFWKAHVSAVKRGELIDQRDLDRARGKLEGIRALLSAPDKAAASLLRKQEKDDAA